MPRKKKRSGKWMQSAVKRPGQLHRDLGVPQGKKIPHATLQAAAKKKGKVGQRARFALTAKKITNKRKRKKKSGNRKHSS